MTQYIKFIVCAVCVFMGGYAQAGEQWQVASGQSNVNFILYSTFHEVNGRVQAVTGSIQQELRLAKGSVDVSIAGITTDNKERDKDMYETFDVSHYPQIHFVFDHMDISNVLERHEANVVFSGVMTIHNISHPMNLLSRGHVVGNTLTCEGRMNIHLKDYALNPPSVLGFIRVKDEIKVQYKIVFVNKEDVHGHS